MKKAACAVGFVILATLNSAGYRFAASDQAFYVPAILRHLDPALFPRDAPLIDSQAKLTGIDEAIALMARVSGLSLQHLLLALYMAALVTLLAGAARVGSRLYRDGWTIAALGVALTLRHAIAKTGANTLEGYFHPRQVAFAIGIWAVAEFLRRRDWAWVALVVAAAAVHPTTAAWFSLWLGAATFVARPRWRPAMLGLAALAVLAIAALYWRGALAGRLVRMDTEWLAAIGEKDLYPLAWPLNVWFTNLLPVAIILACWRSRHRDGLTVARETPLALGSMVLVAAFLCWLPFNAARIAIAVQLQTARVFWLLDVFATIYAVWWLCERRKAVSRGAVVTAVLLVLSLGRGLYTCYVQFPDRRLFAVDVQHDDWREAMRFAASTDPSSGWLADPIHAARYGASVRAVGRRDVLIEELKDRAIAMYDRDVAMRVNDRLRALEALPWDTPDGARGLARRFGLDYLVIDRELALPLAHRSGSLYIYRIR
jgi:hypothetical protein